MNSVNVLGYLRNEINEFYRYFDFDLPYSQDASASLPRIVIKYWAKQPNPRLIVLPSNTRVAIHGHLDVDKNFGTILLVEQLEVIR